MDENPYILYFCVNDFEVSLFTRDGWESMFPAKAEVLIVPTLTTPGLDLCSFTFVSSVKCMSWKAING